MSDQADPISYATENCLKYAVKFDRPSPAAADFIAVLKASGTMSADELAKVTCRVFEKLAERASRARFPPES